MHWERPSAQPEPTYEAAARLWNQGLDTAAIAFELRVSEALIYNGIGIIRERAAELRMVPA